ncbi:MAG: hypothetical protein ACYDH6_04570 [Acidimicrobiales bacterium]
MHRRRPGRVEVGATGVALTAVVGAWLSHTIEYARLSDVRRAFGSVHVYMGPVGVVLVVAALLGVHSTLRLARRLERRLAALRRHARGSESGDEPLAGAARSFSAPALLLTVWATQCGLYLLQENLEAGFAHQRAPGLAALGGVHALAPLVHLVAALGLVAVLWAVRREVTHLARAVQRAEARLQFVRRPKAEFRSRRSVRAWTPIDRWGTQLWSRPPPAPRVV